MWCAVAFLSLEDGHITIAKPLVTHHRQALRESSVSQGPALWAHPMTCRGTLSPKKVSLNSQNFMQNKLGMTQQYPLLGKKPLQKLPRHLKELMSEEQRCQSSQLWPTWTCSPCSLICLSLFFQGNTDLNCGSLRGRKYENGKLDLSWECLLGKRKCKPGRDRWWRIKSAMVENELGNINTSH